MMASRVVAIYNCCTNGAEFNPVTMTMTYVYFTLATDIQSNRYTTAVKITYANNNKKAVLPQGNRAMLQVFFSVKVRQQHSLQV